MEIAKLALPDFIKNIQTILFLPGRQLCKPRQGGRWWKEVGGKGWLGPSGAAGTGSGPLQPGQGELRGISAVPVVP